jgi:hypothetical protein
MSWKPLLTIPLLFLAPGLALADPAGTFDVKGVNPDDGSAYTGKVRVTRTGETYKVVWTIGDKPLTGIGVGMKMIGDRIVTGPASPDDIGLSVAYSSDGTVGTVIYFEQPDGTWHGTWAYDEWNHVSTEDWIPKERKTVTKVEDTTVKKSDTTIRSLDKKQVISAPKPDQAGPKS